MIAPVCNACQAAIEGIDYPFTCTCPIPTVPASDPATCYECGEPLDRAGWRALCGPCADAERQEAERERDEELHAYYDKRDEDPDPTDGHDEDLRDYDDACEAE